MESADFDGNHPFFCLIAQSLKPALILRSGHPFYPLANFVQQLNSSNPPNVGSLAGIQNTYQATFANLRKIPWTSLDLSELENYIEFIESQMGKFAETNCHFAYQRVLRLILLVFQDIYALSTIKGSKRHFKTKMEEKICELLISLSVFYRTHEVDLQLAESYAREALDMLQEVPDQCGKKVKNSKLLVQMNLALIYLKLGYTESALKMLSEASVNQVYDIEFLDQFFLMLEGYQAAIEYFQTKDIFVAVILCRNLMLFKTIYANGIAKDRMLERITELQYKGFLMMYQEIDKRIPALVSQTQQNYKDKLFQNVRQNEHCNIIENIEFDSENYKVKLKFSDDIENSMIQKAIKVKNIVFKISSNNEAIWYMFDIDALTSHNLGSVCFCIDKLKQNEAKKLEELSRTRAISAVQDACRQVSDAQSYMEPVFFKEKVTSSPLASGAESTQKNAPSKNKRPVKHGDTKKVDSPSKVISPPIVYTWEQSGMNYSSAHKNCPVKHLVSPRILGDVWFGYIAKWVFHDSRYDPEFLNRLTRGVINKDCIRDITKELLTCNDQNFSEKYLYKFKIVIPSGDLRLYGWIDDICKDQEGKMHYLVCFGFIADHKTRFLPNPETLKCKNEMIVAPRIGR